MFVVWAGKGFSLFISNENMDDIKIVESLEKSGLLFEGATETVKHEIKQQEGGFFVSMIAPMTTSLIAPITSSLIQPINSLLINAATGNKQKYEFLPLLAWSLMMEVLGKGVGRTGRGYNNMDKIL